MPVFSTRCSDRFRVTAIRYGSIRRAYKLNDKPVILKNPSTEVSPDSDENQIIDPTVLPTLLSQFFDADECYCPIKSLTDRPAGLMQ